MGTGVSFGHRPLYAFGCGVASSSSGSGRFDLSFTSKAPRRFAALCRDRRGFEFVGVWLAGFGRHLAFETITGADAWKLPATVSLTGNWVRLNTPCPGETSLEPDTVAPTSGCVSPNISFEVPLDGGNGGRIGSHRFGVGGELTITGTYTYTLALHLRRS